MPGAMFLKIAGPPEIPGESTVAGHTGEIEVLSFSLGASMATSPPSTSGSRTSERASFSDITISKVVDKATTQIAKAVALGTPFSSMVISINRADGQGAMVEFLKYTLTDTIISSQQISGSDGAGVPMESFSLAYGQLKHEYTATDPATGAAAGVVPFAFDVGANKVV